MSDMADDLLNRFSFHQPKLEQEKIYDKIRSDALVLAVHLAANCPQSRELSLALTHLEETVFWANAAIARHDSM